MMKCEEIIHNIPRYIEETLSEHERLLFLKHLRQCDYCFQAFTSAQKSARAREKWIQITAVLNLFLVLSAIVYFAFGPLLMAKFREFAATFNPKHARGSLADNREPVSGSLTKVQSNIYLKPLHWDMYFQDRSQLDGVSARLRYNKIKVLYEDSGLLILTLNRVGLELLRDTLSEAGGSFQSGGSLYSFKFPEFEGDFRISVHMKFPQRRVSQPLAHHWHLKFQLPNEFVAKDSIREVGARILYDAPEIWVVQVPGKDFDRLKSVLRATHGLEADFGTQSIPVDTYGNIPVTISLYITEG